MPEQNDWVGSAPPCRIVADDAYRAEVLAVSDPWLKVSFLAAVKDDGGVTLAWRNHPRCAAHRAYTLGQEAVWALAKLTDPTGHLAIVDGKLVAQWVRRGEAYCRELAQVSNGAPAQPVGEATAVAVWLREVFYTRGVGIPPLRAAKSISEGYAFARELPPVPQHPIEEPDRGTIWGDIAEEWGLQAVRRMAALRSYGHVVWWVARNRRGDTLTGLTAHRRNVLETGRLWRPINGTGVCMYRPNKEAE